MNICLQFFFLHLESKICAELLANLAAACSFSGLEQRRGRWRVDPTKRRRRPGTQTGCVPYATFHYRPTICSTKPTNLKLSAKLQVSTDAGWLGSWRVDRRLCAASLYPVRLPTPAPCWLWFEMVVDQSCPGSNKAQLDVNVLRDLMYY